MADNSYSRMGQEIYNVKDTFLDSETSSVSPPHAYLAKTRLGFGSLQSRADVCQTEIQTVYENEELLSICVRRQTHSSADLQLCD